MKKTILASVVIVGTLLWVPAGTAQTCTQDQPAEGWIDCALQCESAADACCGSSGCRDTSSQWLESLGLCFCETICEGGTCGGGGGGGGGSYGDECDSDEDCVLRPGWFSTCVAPETEWSWCEDTYQPH